MRVIPLLLCVPRKTHPTCYAFVMSQEWGGFLSGIFTRHWLFALSQLSSVIVCVVTFRRYHLGFYYANKDNK